LLVLKEKPMSLRRRATVLGLENCWPRRRSKSVAGSNEGSASISRPAGETARPDAVIGTFVYP
jgi:hypothetical protein